MAVLTKNRSGTAPPVWRGHYTITNNVYLVLTTLQEEDGVLCLVKVFVCEQRRCVWLCPVVVCEHVSGPVTVIVTYRRIKRWLSHFIAAWFCKRKRRMVRRDLTNLFCRDCGRTTVQPAPQPPWSRSLAPRFHQYARRRVSITLALYDYIETVNFSTLDLHPLQCYCWKQSFLNMKAYRVSLRYFNQLDAILMGMYRHEIIFTRNTTHIVVLSSLALDGAQFYSWRRCENSPSIVRHSSTWGTRPPEL